MNYIKDKEKWKLIKGYEDFYEISNFGRVRSLDRLTNNSVGTFVRKGKMLKPSINRSGYKFVLLTDGNKNRKLEKIHRLVALNFIDNPLSKPFVNHIDGDKLNNKVGNLEWCTPLENTTHAIENKLFVPSQHCRKGRIIRKVGMYSKDGEHLKTFDTCKSAAQFVGTDSKTIIKVCNGYRNYKSAKGYKWKYI
ncbi:MAG: HNH endonuclease [Staphylococcus sp.]|uniref:NUMOD4 domain-containing protein n=1 Tax=Streptomyces gardneri TaxID=66892 RepID=UPI0034072AC1|nr:HNH endonuclease [Staphylococcus sp.]